MANQEHLDLLKQGSSAWYAWRVQHKEVEPDLSGADLSRADLSRADLSRANLFDADLIGANLTEANLSDAFLQNANLSDATLFVANLSNVTLREAFLMFANLSNANLFGANLSDATLYGATLVGTNFTDAILTGCHIYGIAAWKVKLTGATQDSLVITPEDEPEITVDNLKIAQFIYLLLDNQEIRDVIDTIAKKAVLILGRFTSEQKTVLDALRDELRRRGYLPILFDFKKPSSRNLTETVSTLAHLSRFIIADLTDPRSIPNELRAIIPILRVPVQPLLHILEEPYGMFEDFRDYPWVLPTHRYTNLNNLLASLQRNVIDPAEQKAKQLEKR